MSETRSREIDNALHSFHGQLPSSSSSSSSSSSIVSNHDCIGTMVQTRHSLIQTFEHLYISLLIEWKKGTIVG